MTRQRKYQIRMRRAHRCVICGSRDTTWTTKQGKKKVSNLCPDHREQNRQRNSR